MTFVRKTAAVLGLAAITLSAFAAAPASAQYYHHHYYRPYAHPMQRRNAVRLDRRAARAAYNGNYYRAHRLRHDATRLRHAANHGY